MQFNDHLTYGDVFLQNEVEFSKYNFEEASISFWQSAFEGAEQEATRLIAAELPLPAYNFALKASHAFNMLDARGAISTTARVDLIHRIKALSCLSAEAYLKKREVLGFPPSYPYRTTTCCPYLFTRTTCLLKSYRRLPL